MAPSEEVEERSVELSELQAGVTLTAGHPVILLVGGVPGNPDGTGDEGTGDQGTGDEGTGDEGTGDEGTGDEGTGDEGTGDEGTGDEGTGDEGTGDEGTGDEGTGDEGTGDEGTGDEGTGDEGTGDEGTGDEGTGTEPAPDIPTYDEPRCQECHDLKILVDAGTVSAKIKRKSEDKDAVKLFQYHMVKFGYDLGKGGPKKDGVDGGFGQMSADASSAFFAEIGVTESNPDSLSADEAKHIIEMCEKSFKTKGPPQPTNQPQQAGWQTEEWVTNAPSTADFTGEQTYSETTLTKAKLYDAISTVAPVVPHQFKVMLVGHAWVEQGGKHIINFNFAGIEGGSKAYVQAWTSMQISRSKYEANPSAYKDWGKGNVWHEKDAGTIQVQLDRGETELIVMGRAKRPAFPSLEAAAAGFVREIERRIRALQHSSASEHQQLAQAALAGGDEAYGKIVGNSFWKIKDGFGAFNPDSGYPGRVKSQIASARKDLAGNAPQV